MLWLVDKDASYEIVSCNIHLNETMYELWVTRTNGKSLKIDQDTNRTRIDEIKEAIDYAIEHNEKVLRL